MVATGLCHSDYHLITGDYGFVKGPLIGGHEGSGIVEKIGPEVHDLQSSAITCSSPSCRRAASAPGAAWGCRACATSRGDHAERASSSTAPSAPRSAHGRARRQAGRSVLAHRHLRQLRGRPAALLREAASERAAGEDLSRRLLRAHRFRRGHHRRPARARARSWSCSAIGGIGANAHPGCGGRRRADDHRARSGPLQARHGEEARRHPRDRPGRARTRGRRFSS